MDGRKNNGGHSTAGRAGRKPKDEELKIVERLDNIINQDEAIHKLKELIEKGNLQAIKLYLNYRYGQPRESIDVHQENSDGINFNELIKYVDTPADAKE